MIDPDFGIAFQVIFLIVCLALAAATAGFLAYCEIQNRREDRRWREGRPEERPRT